MRAENTIKQGSGERGKFKTEGPPNDDVSHLLKEEGSGIVLLL